MWLETMQVWEQDLLWSTRSIGMSPKKLWQRMSSCTGCPHAQDSLGDTWETAALGRMIMSITHAEGMLSAQHWRSWAEPRHQENHMCNSPAVLQAPLNAQMSWMALFLLGDVCVIVSCPQWARAWSQHGHLLWGLAEYGVQWTCTCRGVGYLFKRDQGR